MKTKAKSLVSLLLAVCMVLTLSLGLTGCGSAKATTPRLRINPENNYWEVSYDDGSTWESMNVAATGVAGKDGKDGVNGKDGTNGINGANGKNGVDGINGADGKNGTDGINGTNGTNGLTPTIGHLQGAGWRQSRKADRRFPGELLPPPEQRCELCELVCRRGLHHTL